MIDLQSELDERELAYLKESITIFWIIHETGKLSEAAESIKRLSQLNLPASLEEKHKPFKRLTQKQLSSLLTMAKSSLELMNSIYAITQLVLLIQASPEDIDHYVHSRS